MHMLVVGSAAGVWDDLKSVPGDVDAVVAVNRMIRAFPTVPKFGATLHPDKAESLGREGTSMVSTRLGLGIHIGYDQLPFRNGTSSLYAVGFCLLLGAARVTLAGCPIDDGPHFSPQPALKQIAAYRAPWQQLAPMLRDRNVTSLSGWTRDLLSSPS